ncbi:MAG TPA: FtsX-like permease family protein, partial [Verrucomicrobiae bacterium]|nr:FtsX-like permease family protein [Verrucomicrobiae bacterium]
AGIDPDQPIHSIGTLESQAVRSLQGLQVVGVMTGIFGLVAALLASMGVYGVTSFAVNQRTREFGIRIALGSQLWRIFQLVLRQGVTQLGVGLVAGVGLAFLMVRPLAPFLTEVSVTGPSTYVGVAALLMVVTGLAIWLPARRAAKVDPMEALRTE